MKPITMLIGAALAALFLSGCAKDQATLQAEAGAVAAAANARVAEAQASAEESRAVIALAAKIDAGGASAYLIAKALKGMGVGSAQPVQVVQQPQSLVGLAWQSALQLGDLALRYWGVKANRDVSVIQSNNNRDVALSTNASFVGMGSSIERAGVAGYAYVQAPVPNWTTTTLSGTGVLGSGTYTGPVTRTCNGGTGAAGGGAAAGTATAPGGPGGPGGSATGGNC